MQRDLEMKRNNDTRKAFPTNTENASMYSSSFLLSQLSNNYNQISKSSQKTFVENYLEKKNKAMLKSLRQKEEILSQWIVPPRYRLDKLVGSGSYGNVAKAYDRVLNRDVAIKRIENVFIDIVDAQRTLREIYILRHLNNPYIVKILDVFTNKEFPTYDEIYIVMEYMPFDLSKTISSRQYWTEEPVRYIIFQMLAGIEYLHRYRIVHRDLKPANILLDTSAQVKICDFGLSRQILPPENESPKGESMLTQLNVDIDPSDSDETSMDPDYNGNMALAERHRMSHRLTEHVCTRWYRAPEVLLLCQYSEKIDVWSIGCVFAELLQMIKGNCPNYKERKALFPGTKCDLLSPGLEANIPESERMEQLEIIYNTIGGPMNEYINKVNRINKDHKFQPFPYHVEPVNWSKLFPYCSAKGLHLLSHLCKIDPDERYTVKQCLLHPYLYDLTVSKNLPLFDTPSPFQFLPDEMSEEEVVDRFITELSYFHSLNMRNNSFPDYGESVIYTNVIGGNN